MTKKKFYITTTSSYVNADPHIGYALELLQADAITRFKKQTGYEVAFGYGTDEHGLKIYKKASEAKKSPQEYCDEKVKKFMELKKLLNLSSSHFIRSTDPFHVKAAQEFWNRCYKNGDIYKKNYRIKYCYGCELEKTDSELENGICPIHPNLKIENYEEENYFFKFSKYQNKLLAFYRKNKSFVIPHHRLTEIETFVKKGLQDFSISRLKSKMPWGVDVPNDPDHVMYVWFDALVYYISTLGWPSKLTEYQKFWPGVQAAGKDNLRQQSAIWQAMLMSAGLPNTKQVFIHGFITSEGKKISKSLGNVIDPYGLVKQYGIDAVRYYLLRELPPSEDGDFSHKRMKEVYDSDLANELGNLVSRLTNLAEKDSLTVNNEARRRIVPGKTVKLFDSFQFNKILENIWLEIKSLNKSIDDFAPWNKKPEERKDFLLQSINRLKQIGTELLPFIPNTAEKIIKSTEGKIKKSDPLFPKLI
ncbi:methionine--tRNA ligase [Candidatus Roizmanbacteria bacterium RIFCSPLOWO2_01_FULL_35_13]|uniref:Methionine--tRNA ligase n=1 Tax=Candidatus Roizmanbacteria bacterium RIFCSPLOWO2_01_FULL_35_13 TaxID=1802055 RepID=A0A1F7IH96_9BACT|nr:MAG: methionine--tRNA ligase [Candidatus Roizmanbacteria bacterium RIFCSPLOWO2_01_FULL_35_13]